MTNDTSRVRSARERRLSRRDAIRTGGVAVASALGGCTTDEDATTGGPRERPGDTTDAEPTVETQANAAVGSWPLFQADTANTGHAETTGPTSSVRERWRFQPDLPAEESAAVVDGTVYVGSQDHNVYALAVDDGTVQWGTDIGDKVYSSPAVVDGTVYVGSDGKCVYALDADDGTERWRFETDGQVVSSLVVDDDTVYGGTLIDQGEGGENEPDPPDTGAVFALAADDGTERWRFETEREVVSSPAVVDGTVYVGHEYVYALEEAE